LGSMRAFGIVCTKKSSPSPRSFNMSETIKSEVISRRKALSLMGLAAVLGLAAATTVLTVSDADAQTGTKAGEKAVEKTVERGTGTERRHERREGRHERRHGRREGRHERREERREGRHERRHGRREGRHERREERELSDLYRRLQCAIDARHAPAPVGAGEGVSRDANRCDRRPPAGAKCGKTSWPTNLIGYREFQN